MRTSRCILFTVAGTLLCLFHVFLQTEIVKFGYKITAAQKLLEVQYDRKTSLEYALSSLESPLNLDKNLFLKEGGFQLPQHYRLVKIAPAGGRDKALVTEGQRRVPLLQRFALYSLFVGRQAEAKTIK